MNKKWKKFDNLTTRCYENMAGLNSDKTCWTQAFDLLKEIIEDERKSCAQFAPELYVLDEVTDYKCDVQGWLEDYLDELDMKDDQESLLKSCEEILELFRWKEICSSDIKFRKVSALSALKRYEEAVSYCDEWLNNEPDNIMAITASVYGYIDANKLENAGELIEKYIGEDTECTEENDILFIAAFRYYQAVGNKKEKKKIDAILEEYDRQVEEFLMGEEDNELSFIEDELPFF